MRNFSIIPCWDKDPIDQYTDFLTNEVYRTTPPWTYADLQDPLFLQKLGLLRAAGIQRAVETSGAVMYYGLSDVNDTVRQSTQHLSRQLGASAAIVTSSLDRGFTALNHSLEYIGSGIDTTNAHLSNINGALGGINSNLEDTNRNLQSLGRATAYGFTMMHKGLEANAKLQAVTNEKLSAIHNSLGAINQMVGEALSRVYNQLCISKALLSDILTELKIPETQRERRYHIEEGSKYLGMALADNDRFYFEDAIDEFEKAIVIERKDFFSWYNLGFIYLRSTQFIDIEKAMDAFERYVHYAKAEITQRNNKKLEHQLDDVYLMMAEIKYLQKLPLEAVVFTDKCRINKEKASFMKAKYLSATYQRDNQEKAAEILHTLLDENPLLALNILEDNDLIANDYVIWMLDYLRQEAVKKVKQLRKELGRLAFKYTKELSAYNAEITSMSKMIGTTTVEPISIFEFAERLEKIDNLISSSTYLDSVEASGLIEDLNKDLARHSKPIEDEHRHKMKELTKLKDSFNPSYLLSNCQSMDEKINRLLSAIDSIIKDFEQRVSFVEKMTLRSQNFDTYFSYIRERLYVTEEDNSSYFNGLQLYGNRRVVFKDNPIVHNNYLKSLSLSGYSPEYSLYAKMKPHYNNMQSILTYIKNEENRCKEKLTHLQNLIKKRNDSLSLSERFTEFREIESKYNSLLQSCKDLVNSFQKYYILPQGVTVEALNACKNLMLCVIQVEDNLPPFSNPYGLFSLERGRYKRNYENALAELRTMTTKAKNIIKIIDKLLRTVEI